MTKTLKVDKNRNLNIIILMQSLHMQSLICDNLLLITQKLHGFY